METILSAINNILFLLVGLIYNVICWVYDIFYFLCEFQLFGDEDYNQIVSRIYLILGVIMIFVLAYSLLKAVINPDEFSKGESSFPKLVKNIVISLAILTILPTVFNVAFSIQNSLLNYSVIQKVILGTGTEGSNGSALSIDNVSGGRYIAFYTYKAFLYPNVDSGICSSDDEDACRSNIQADGWWIFRGSKTLDETDEDIFNGSTFTYYGEYSKAVAKGELNFNWLFAAAAGIFIIYVLLNFCFDMALRVIKLAFYQIIAPIPVVCRIIPGGKMKDVFGKWLKQVISLFVEVFVRIGALTFGVYLISIVVDKLNTTSISVPGVRKLFIAALLIMSVIMFVKQMPKLIGDLLGLDTGGMKLGLKDKLAAGGALTAAATIGGVAGAAGRNLVKAGQNFKNAETGKAKLGAAFRGIGSVAAGGLSGGTRGFMQGRHAKNFKDVRDASGKAVAGATMARERRDAYRAGHAGESILMSHLADARRGVGEYFGINSMAELQKEKEAASTMQGFYKEMASLVEDDASVANYTGLLAAENERKIEDTVTSFDNKGYMAAINSRVKAMQGDSRYSHLSQSDLYNIAGSEVDRNQFTSIREITAEERANATAQREKNIEKYENLKKLATIKAINKKLNEKGVDGKIKDGRFQTVANKVEVFKQQNSTYDFVENMNSISGVNWDSSWDAVMRSDDFGQIETLLNEFKNGTNDLKFYADSKIGESRKNAAESLIANKIYKEKSENGK